MSQPDVYRPPVTFQDVAAYFSEEEWKLLLEWQNELYENVIKEIQQAMTTLGSLIATSVFSLRPKPKEDLYPMDHHFLKMRGLATSSPKFLYHNSDIALSKEHECETSVMDHHVAQTGESRNDSNAADNAVNTAVLLKMKEEGAPSLVDYEDSAVGESIRSTNAGYLFTKTEIPFIVEAEGTSARKHERAEKKENTKILTGRAAITPIVSCSANNIEGETYFTDNKDSWGDDRNQTKQKDIPQFVPFIIKEDGLAYTLDHQGLETSGNISTPTHDGLMRIKRKYTKRIHPLKSAFGRGRTKVFQGSRRGTYSGSLLWQRSNLQLGGENTTLHGNGFLDEVQSDLQHLTSNQCENVKRKTNYAACPQDTATLCEKLFSHTGSTVEDQGSSSQLLEVSLERKIPYQSTPYEKTFDQMKPMVGPERAIIAEKPYTCFKCDKCFSQMASLIRHQATHSEEKPFQCTECDKSYNRNDNLIRHQKSHTRGFRAT